MSTPATGLYVSAEALAQSPDYARALVEEHGVNCFVVRAGFDPAHPSPHIEPALSVARNLGASVQFLVGAWWGAGMDSITSPMVPARKLMDYDGSEANEVQWDMVYPDAENNAVIRDTLLSLCRDYAPDGICLTHARFKHAADINHLFAHAPGKKNTELASALDRFCERLASGAPLPASTSLPAFLDAVSETDLFTRWFENRCSVISDSLASIFEPVRAEFDSVQLGTNAVGPMFSKLSGQDYEPLSGVCDFIQPLLGYMRWHVLQPIYMWAKFFAQRCPSLNSTKALCLSATLFGFLSDELSLNWNDRNNLIEGDEAAIIKMVEKQLSALPSSSTGFMPVLRGHGLCDETSISLSRIVRKTGNGQVIYQGSDFLGGEPPHPGWK